MKHHPRSTRLIDAWMLPALLVLVLGGCSPRPPKHGTAFVVALDTRFMAKTDAPAQAQALDRMRAVLQNRLQALGARFSLEPDAQGRLLVKVPDLPDAELAVVRRVLSRPGRLEFRRVRPGAVPDTAGPADVPPVYEEMMLKTQRPDGAEQVERLYVKRFPEMTGEAMSSATVAHDDRSRPQIILEFTRDGATRFGVVTRGVADEGRVAGTRARLAIMVDGELLCAPAVMEAISGGRAQITGTFTEREASELCAALNNPLDIWHRIVEERKF